MKEYFNLPDDTQRLTTMGRRTIQKFEPWAYNALMDCTKARDQIDVIRQHLINHEVTQALAALIPAKIWLEEVDAFIQAEHCCFDDDHPMVLKPATE